MQVQCNLQVTLCDPYLECEVLYNKSATKIHFLYLLPLQNKCIGGDTKAAARQSLNCIKTKKNKIWRKRFSICRVEFLHPAMWHDHDIDFVRWLNCGMWLWNRDSKFTKWQHPAMWYVAVGWHAIEFDQTSAILEFYIWFPFPHITAVDMSFYIYIPVCEIFSKSTTLGRKNDVMSIFKMVDLSHLGL